ncbi:hypothetical protein [Jiangella asiatica]|uniref:Uncharacterized protein n=1 Tax=Jiangella asiatica TaxID=2530372 RepID=A0A4R5D4I7_9ACTN|nr:hypothetical protein [Jiangella asiatica]TDE08216.1 hypothetical protein E1269_18075 [Jiangella asiatica]
MTNWRARARLLAFACVTGLVLTGCGDDGGQADDQVNGAGSGETEGAEDQSPLAEFLGEGAGFAATGRMVTMASSAGDLSEEDRQKMRRVEELVAECMREQGFEYVPMDPAGGGDAEDDPFADAFSLPPDEFAREYGYGISTLMGAEAPEGEAEDPNQEIREGLSESAREAYDQALWGDLAEVSEGGGAVSVQPLPSEDGAGAGEPGCHQQASDEVHGEQEGAVTGPDMSEFEGLFDDMEALRQRIESDPRVTEATGAWADCMAAAGYSDVETIHDPEDQVMSRMSELYGWDTQGEGEEGQTNVIAGPEEPDVDEAALRELQDFEIAIATADYECEQEHYADVQREVAVAMEEQFVEEHRAELERYRDAMAEGPAGHAGGLG